MSFAELGCVDCANSICRDCDPDAQPADGFWKEQMTTPDIAGLCERLRAALERATPGPWFAGPLQPEDEYGAPGGVSIGPFDLAERYGSRPDYTPDTFNSHYESTIVEAWGGECDAEANAAFIALSREAVPALLDTLERQAAEIERLRRALENVLASTVGPEVGAGDGGTFILRSPSPDALRRARAALTGED